MVLSCRTMNQSDNQDKFFYIYIIYIYIYTDNQHKYVGFNRQNKDENNRKALKRL